jgi:hypothetical protein
MSQLEKIIRFIDRTCKTYNIDDSHGLGHSLEVLAWSEKLIKDQTLHSETLQVIYLSSILHDMCDKKYMDEKVGLDKICTFLREELEVDENILGDIVFIISNMSYSKVIKYGYPDFKNNPELEYCYHVVRNSDLLCSYDPERCIKYHIRCGGNRIDGIKDMLEIFSERVLMLISNNYINIELAKPYAIELHNKAVVELDKYKAEINIQSNLLIEKVI